MVKTITPARSSKKLTGSQITRTVREVRKAIIDMVSRAPYLSARYDGNVRPKTEEALEHVSILSRKIREVIYLMIEIV